jgi:sugar phosphate isomerase/epimerase
MKKIVMVLIGMCIGIMIHAKPVEVGRSLPADAKVISTEEINQVRKVHIVEENGVYLTVHTCVGTVNRITRSAPFASEADALRKIIEMAEEFRSLKVQVVYYPVGGVVQYKIGKQTDIYSLVIRVVFVGKNWTVQYVNSCPMMDE